MKWNNTDDELAQLLARDMKQYAEAHPCRPGDRLKPYRRLWKAIIEVAFYIDTHHRRANLELVNLLDGTHAFPHADADELYRAFNVPPTAQHDAPSPNYKHRWQWSVTIYKQTPMLHTVK
jgi:hypothetical protein